MAELTPADTVTVRRADLVQALADLDRAYQIFAEVDGLNPRYGTAYRNRLRAALEVAEAVRRRAAEAALATTWETEYGKTLTTARMSQESTPWGPAMVVREPEETHPAAEWFGEARGWVRTSCVECMDRPTAHGSDFCPACQEAHLA